MELILRDWEIVIFIFAVSWFTSSCNWAIDKLMGKRK